MNLTRDELILAILNDPNATERERAMVEHLCDHVVEDNDTLLAAEQTVAKQAEEIKGLENEIERLEIIIAEYKA